MLGPVQSAQSMTRRVFLSAFAVWQSQGQADLELLDRSIDFVSPTLLALLTHGRLVSETPITGGSCVHVRISSDGIE